MDDGWGEIKRKGNPLTGIPETQYGFIFHYYRAEVYRETNWRNRLDTTTNWSIVVTAGIVSFVYSNPTINHGAIILNYLIVWFFIYIESRRYRYYSILRQRTRLLEEYLLAPMFAGKASPKKQWMKELAQTLSMPHVGMSRLQSVAWRIRRNYLFILPLLFLFWLTRISIYPMRADSVVDILENARLYIVPGSIVFYLFLLSLIMALYYAFYIPQHFHADDLP